MRIKKLLAVALSAVLAVSTFGYTSWAADKDGKNSSPKGFEFVPGYVASELDNNTPEYYSDIAVFADNRIPSSYPDNMEEFKSKYPKLRNQNPYGTCWAFSSIGLAEFDLINDGVVKSDVDLSELQLAYFTYNSVVDPLGGTKGDYAKYNNDVASATYLDVGGNYEMSLRRLSQWVGTVNESVVPYSKAEESISNGIDSSYAYGYDTAHLKNAYRINIKTQPDAVKEHIMEHGAVGIMYSHNDAGANYAIKSYYDTSSMYGSGHAVMVVGWDDNYSKNNFKTDTKPANNGAWLVRNSWGDDYFDYFWMSYETYSLSDSAWVFDMSAVDEYDNNYQLDGSLETGIDQYYTQAANVFTVEEKANVESETLKAVSLSFLKTADVEYTVEVYTDLKDKYNPASGTKSASTSGRTSYAGYYTIPLDKEVELKPGSSYAVVLKTDKKAIEYEYTYSTQKDTNDPDSPYVWERAASNNYDVDKTSFYYGYGKYGVSGNSNYRIKAFTTNNYAKSDSEYVAEAKKVVEEAIKDVTAVNTLTKQDIQSVVDAALTNAGIKKATAVVGELNKQEATTSAAGNIKTEITVSYGSVNEIVVFDKTISKLPKTDAEKVKEAKTVVEATVNDINGSNELTQAELTDKVNAALSKAGITEVSVVVDKFNKTEATTDAAGSVKADITVSCGNASDKVVLNKTINKLPKTDAEKVAEAKQVVIEAVNSIVAGNSITKTEVQNIIDEALKKAGITEAKATVGELDMQKATTSAAGSVKADITISYGNASDKVVLNKTISQLPKTDAEKVAEAKAVVEATVNGITGSNELTQEELTNKVNDALSKADVTGVSVVVNNFNKIEATTGAAGSVKADITISCGNVNDKIIFSKVIPQLVITTFGTEGSSDIETSVINADKDEIINKNLKPDEKQYVADGGSIDVKLMINNISDEQNKSEIDKLASYIENNKLGKDDKYLDISLGLTIKDKSGQVKVEGRKLSNAGSKITISIKVPEDMLLNAADQKNGITREYSIIRAHNNNGSIEVEKLDSSYKDGVLTFDSDKFSTYAIVYNDISTKPSQPETQPESKPAPSQPTTKPGESTPAPTKPTTKPADSTTGASEAETTPSVPGINISDTKKENITLDVSDIANSSNDESTEAAATSSDNNPESGDSSHSIIWFIMLIGAALMGATALSTIVIKKKEER